MRTGIKTVDDLKVDGLYFAAGATAYALGMQRSYGCHFGFKSDRDEAIQQFNTGYDAARAANK